MYGQMDVCISQEIPRDASLPESWRKPFIEAMVKGNKIHDDLFDEEAVDLEVEEAVSLADTECGIHELDSRLTFLEETQFSSWLMC